MRETTKPAERRWTCDSDDLDILHEEGSDAFILTTGNQAVFVSIEEFEEVAAWVESFLKPHLAAKRDVSKRSEEP